MTVPRARTAVALLLGTFLIAVACLALVPRAAVADETAIVSPGGGTLRTAFTLSVEGMQPGNGVIFVLYDGAGNRYTYQQGGVDQAFVVDSNGEASMTVTPATDLTGAVAGTWTAVFTEQETGYSATIQFEVDA